MRAKIILLAFCFSLEIAGSLFSQPASTTSLPSLTPGEVDSPSKIGAKVSPIDPSYMNWDANKYQKANRFIQKLVKAFNSNNPKNVKKMLSYKAQKTWGKNLIPWQKSGDLLKIGKALAAKPFIEEWRGSSPVATVFVDGKTIAVMLKPERNGDFKLGLLYDCTNGFDQREVNDRF